MHTVDASFTSLADILRSTRPADQSSPPAPVPTAAHSALPGAGHAELETWPEAVPVGPEPLELLDADSLASGCRCDRASTLRDVRLFRAALADALDAGIAELMERLARDVLGRELELAPADIRAIAARLVAERRADDPVRLRVAPAAAELACGVPVVVDPLLEPGDAILECRSGDIDARLRVRFEAGMAAGAWW